VKGAPWAWEVGPGTDGGTCGAIGSLDGAYSGEMSETRSIDGEVTTSGCAVGGAAEPGGGDASAFRASMRTSAQSPSSRGGGAVSEAGGVAVPPKGEFQSARGLSSELMGMRLPVSTSPSGDSWVKWVQRLMG